MSKFLALHEAAFARWVGNFASHAHGDSLLSDIALVGALLAKNPGMHVARKEIFLLLEGCVDSLPWDRMIGEVILHMSLLV